mgnify:CR=1 FL=1
MIKIKISLGWNMPLKGSSPYGNDLSIFNFTNTSDNIYNNKKFYINSDIDNPDYWFVIENTRKSLPEKLNISSGRIFLLNSETRYKDSYYLKKSKKSFVDQFDKIYSPYYMGLNKVKNKPPYLIWRLRGDPFEDFYDESDIEFYKNLKPKKEKLISVFCTDKEFTEVQKVRLNFVKKLKYVFGDDLDWYGTDLQINTKYDGIAKYKYHLVLENQINNNFISEKLYDSFLGDSYPIYAGAPNLDKYFSKNSFTPINLNDFNGSLNKISTCIENNMYEKNKENLRNSREIVLDKFNLIKRIDKIVEECAKNNLSTNSFQYQTIYPKTFFESRSVIARLSFLLNKKIKKISQFLEKFYT